MFTILILSFHSRHLIVKLVKTIDRNIPILIIENSQDKELKDILEREYKNVRVIIPNENLGFSKAANLGINESKTDYVFFNPADVLLPKKCIEDLLECVTKFNNFAMFAPTYKDESVYKNYELYSKKPVIENNISEKFGMKEVDIIDGTFIIKKSEFKKIGLLDENIFIYFETWDLSKRVAKAGKKMYVCEKIKFEHLGGQSHNPKFNFQASLQRNWHYCWSKFYYLRKYNNYFYALKKTLPTLIKSSIKYMKFMLSNNKKQSRLHLAEIKGLIAAYLLRKSSYRPYESSNIE
tara:strand:- start:5094 stop:5972 length:879 start_codon:yes stop_codon:yes gene_type:complete